MPPVTCPRVFTDATVFPAEATPPEATPTQATPTQLTCGSAWQVAANQLSPCLPSQRHMTNGCDVTHRKSDITEDQRGRGPGSVAMAAAYRLPEAAEHCGSAGGGDCDGAAPHR